MAKWIEVVDAWKGVCTPLTWPMQSLSVAQRQQIGMVTLTSKEFVARVVDRVQSNQPLGPMPRGGANNVKMTVEVVDFIADLYARNVELEI